MFIMGLTLVEAMPFLVEVGVLLDLFVGVFVMGIVIYHISRAVPRTFRHGATSRRCETGRTPGGVILIPAVLAVIGVLDTGPTRGAFGWWP